MTVRPPELPAAWAERGLAPRWAVLAVWPGGEARSEMEPGEPARLTLPRGERAAILAVPVCAGRDLRPAGAVCPGDGAAEPVLTWEGGYRAETARVLIRVGIDPGCFDLERFSREAIARLGDPWLKPPETFAESLAAKTFRVVWLNPGPSWSFRSPALPGSAASESPFGSGLVPDGEGRADISLPAGVHRWYADWGRVSVEVSESGRAVWIIVRH